MAINHPYQIHEHLLAEVVLHKLTPTERKLFDLVMAGLKIEEIAQEMNINKKASVSSMKRDLLEKLQGLLNGKGEK